MAIKIPNNSKKHSVATNSDLFGTISYTKNINLDEEGYIKLADRTVQLQSEKIDANMGLPIAFGRKESSDTVSFRMVTSSEPYDIEIAENEISTTRDETSGITYTPNSHGRWFHNLWISTDNNGFLTINVSNSWDLGDTSTLTASVAHPIEVFEDLDRICFGDGNTVKSYSESGGTFTIDKTLTLPSEFEVVGLAYENGEMAVTVQLSVTIEGQNKNAQIFIWDGLQTSGSPGISIGSDRPLGLCPYKGSYSLLNRLGQLRFFTGGGWQELAQLAFYFLDRVFGSSSARDFYGDVLVVEGDVIYINNNGLLKRYGEKYQKYLPSNPGGILAYDPKIGLYQKYSHSISPVSMLTVTQANVNTTTDIMTVTGGGTIPTTGSPVKYTSNKAAKIGGLKTARVYYCIRHNATQFSLATTKANALDAVKIDLTSTGDTNNYFMALEIYDYGTTLANNIGGMSLVGTDNGICNHLIFGAQLQDFNTTNQKNTLELVVTGFENRGYFVTPKLNSDGITDKHQKIYIKYRPLKTYDKIIVKVKEKDILGLPVSTPQGYTSTPNQCVYTSTTIFTTVADLEDAKTAFDANNELECEIIAGAGAGNMVKISDITFSAGTYTVTLAEAPDGSASGRYCDVLIENWRYLGIITSDDVDGYKEFGVEGSKPWVKYKIELRGVDTTIEEIQPVHQVDKKAE